MCIHELFEIQARMTPDATALACGEKMVSYGELDRRSNRLAHTLQSLGIGPEVIVALVVERSIEMVVAMLGILKAGGAYLCIDPEYPAERQAFMLEDSRAKLVFAQRHLVACLSQVRPHTIILDDPELVAAGDDGPVVSPVTVENLAYLTYTSGSTGNPKGTEVPHRSIPGYMFDVHYVELNSRDIFLQYNSLSWDALTLELWTPLLHGGRSVLFPGRVPALHEMANAIHNHGVTIMFFTGSLFNIVVDSIPEILTGLKHLWVGGEVVSIAHVKRAQAFSSAPRIVNVYGPSECTVFTTAYIIPDQISEDLRSIPIGKIIGDRKVYLLDESSRPVLRGTPGELCVGGPAVARGYLNRPELTAAAFTPDPFSKSPGARIYRSGDLARSLSDGNIEFVGRHDRQIKVRGFRIEPAEIEWILRKHEAISDVAIVIKEEMGNKQIIAYVAPQLSWLRPIQNSVKDYSSQQVSEWQSIFEDIYLPHDRNSNPLFNFTGWNSSYTGKPIPEQEMREWLSGTVERILSLKPKNLLDLGCGMGLLLFQIAPYCGQYYACDFSPQALNYVRQQLNRLRSIGEDFNSVILNQHTAQDFTGIHAGTFDVVVLNSVVQYFPDGDYLKSVVKNALAALSPGGHIFIGDVRSLPLLETLHVSIELNDARASEPCTHLWDSAKKRVLEERELVVDPLFFLALSRGFPQISGIEILLKRGHEPNELNRYRYDVILHTSPIRHEEIVFKQWKGSQSWGDLRDLLAGQTAPDAAAFQAIPNARLIKELKAVEYLKLSEQRNAAELRKKLQESDASGIDPEEFWALGKEYGYDVEIGWDGPALQGSYRVVLKRTKGTPSRPILCSPIRELPPSDIGYANRPITTQFIRKLPGELRGYLKSKLPEYMVPAAFVILQELPRTISGKLDYKRLPELDEKLLDINKEHSKPKTAIEETILGFWKDILDLDKIGTEENFFELGGHSLMATQVISRIRETYKIDLPLRSLFEAGTVARLSQEVEQIVKTGEYRPRQGISITDRAALKSRAIKQLMAEQEKVKE
jgi:amino acid adenylation domain-containing protein